MSPAFRVAVRDDREAIVSAASRVALVTGGTGALGQAVTMRLLADGLRVCAPYIVEPERDALLGRAGAARDRLEVIHADVTGETALASLVDDLHARHGRLDVLVMLVGGFAGGALVETDHATWDRMLALNLTTAFTTARAVVPRMVRARHGRIVTIGSRAVVPPAAGFIAYTVSKAGVIAFSQALAQELRGTGVTVNCVLPSTMDTPANRAAMPDSDRSGWVPVESVAEAIAFLASDGAGHVTGSLVTV
jgi:NAD(P)-dependent dehydrogenase (short-subunit alcohol dehydrogenase family)